VKTLLENTHTNINNSFNSIADNNNIFGKKDFSITFKRGLKSVDLPSKNFINFLQRSDTNYISFIRKEIKKLYYGNVDILSEYKDKFITKDRETLSQMEAIFMETYGYNIRLPFLKRLSKIRNSRFQLFYKVIDEDTIEIMFIDLYHLIIPAADVEHGEEEANPENTYNEFKDSDYNLTEILSRL